MKTGALAGRIKRSPETILSIFGAGLIIAAIILVVVAYHNHQQDRQYEQYYSQGVQYQRQHHYLDALQAYQKAAEVKPTFEALRATGSLAQKAGNRQLALRYYRRALAALDSTQAAQAADARSVIEADINVLQRPSQGPHR
jgi:tetratricopeptide (TPR) repeat protein